MEWELSKENVRPLKEGRNVEKLNTALKASMTSAAKSRITEQHRKMVEAIDDYDGDDPIEPWLRCIQWVKEAYPSGGSQSGLLKLLELCVRTFWKDERYQKDLRYLKVWLEYADRCKDPREIFSFLQVNDIGQDHALFYETCAKFWEHQQKLTNANDIFRLGISRKAHPLESLQNSYKVFLKRSAKTVDDKKDDVSSIPNEVGRVFGTNITGQQLPSTLRQKTSSNQRTKPGGFSVFVDPVFQQNSTSVHENHWGLNYKSSKNMNIVVPETEKDKENTQFPVKWVGAKIPHRAVLPSAAPTVSLDVFVDEELAGSSTVSELEKCSKRSVSTILRLRLDDIHGLNREADRLQQSPLIHFAEDGLHVDVTG